VLEWLDNHGELFLRKNTGIGKTLQRARVLQKSQMHFENVAKTTYTNAEKLLAAAEELAGTGETRSFVNYRYTFSCSFLFRFFVSPADQSR
jgi:hypothetical protein